MAVKALIFGIDDMFNELKPSILTLSATQFLKKVQLVSTPGRGGQQLLKTLK